MTVNFDSQNANVYRKDIDGLRAIAVSLVILFHIGTFGVTGGFIGVDVFFVISGYLISQRILNSLDQGTFSFKEFYTRRIRRLFPAMLVTVLCTLSAGWFFLGPLQLKELFASALSSVLSFANVHFFLQSGYWDADALEKPLLHMWSLGVEEQFYFFWPFFLLGLARVKGGGRWALIGVAILLSLWLTTWFTQQNPSGAFYLTPFRVYEFAIGTLCTASDKLNINRLASAKLVQSIGFLIGLGLILASGLMFSEKLPFPSYWAIVPCVGTGLVIIARCPPGISWILTNPVFRYVGLISYSLYLIHWPVIVFVRAKFGEPDFVIALCCIAITFVLAIGQYHFIEQPFRRPRGRQPKAFDSEGSFTRAGFGVATSVAIVSAAAVVIFANNGFPNRFDLSRQEFLEVDTKQVVAEREALRKKTCTESGQRALCGQIKEGRVNVLIVGDSHADDALNALSVAYPDANFLVAAARGCPLLVESENFISKNKTCAQQNEVRQLRIQRLLPNLDYIVFAQKYYPDFQDEILESFEHYNKGTAKLVVMGANPMYSDPVLRIAVRHGSIKGLEETVNKFALTDQYDFDERAKNKILSLGGEFVSKRGYFCPNNGSCRVLLPTGEFVGVDKDHLTVPGARAFGRYLRKTNPDLFSASTTKGVNGGSL